jgi:hypothetical protein
LAVQVGEPCFERGGARLESLCVEVACFEAALSRSSAGGAGVCVGAALSGSGGIF